MPREAGRSDAGAVAKLPVGLPRVCREERAVQMSGGDLGAGVGAVLLLHTTERGCYKPPISSLTPPKGRSITSLTNQNLRHWLNMGANGQGHSDKTCGVGLLASCFPVGVRPSGSWTSASAGVRHQLHS